MANYLEQEKAAKTLARWLGQTNGEKRYKNEIEGLRAQFTDDEWEKIENWKFNEPIV